ncbi:MAG: hypothetical protein QM756_11605 [Polyangiaceae bacterium]
MADAKPSPASDRVSKASAQALVRNIAPAVKRFKELLKDDELVENGQFIWAVRYENEFRKFVGGIVKASRGEVRKFWLPAGQSKTPAGRLIRTAGRSRRAGDAAELAFEKDVKATLANKVWQDGSAEANKLVSLLKNAGGAGAAAHAQATQLISQGQRVRPADVTPTLDVPAEAKEATKNFGLVFAEGRLSFRGVLSINQASASGCFDTSRAVARFIVKKKGLRAVPPDPAFSPGQVFDQSKKFVSFQPPLHDLVAFTPTLGNSIGLATKALDQACLLNCPVLSGESLNGPDLAQSDHSILILAWEIHTNPFDHFRFGFWDPDASVSNAIEPGFGLLFFLNQKVAPKQAATGPDIGTPQANGKGAYAASFYQSGRFTTALTENALHTVPGSNGDDVNGQHRYQAIALESIPVKLPQKKK